MRTTKLLGLALALCLIISLLAGCGGKTDTVPTDTQSAQTEETPATDETPEPTIEVELTPFKIGLIASVSSGGGWDLIADAINYLADELNCEVTTPTVANSPDQILAAIENYIAADVDGIIAFNNGGITPRMVQACEAAGVYLVFSEAGQLKDEGYETVEKSEYLLGEVAPDEYAVAKEGAQIMIDNGAKNVVVFGLPPGISPSFDMRATGAIDAVKAAGLADPVEARGYQLPEIAGNLMAQYPDTDAIFGFVTTQDSFNVPDMVAKYGGKLQVSAYMVGDVTEEMESGFLTQVSVGPCARAELSFALLYNAMRGDRLSQADGSAPNILFQDLWITNVADFKKFIAKTTGGNHAYSIDEIKQLIKAFNPNVTIGDYQELADEFTTSWLNK